VLDLRRLCTRSAAARHRRESAQACSRTRPRRMIYERHADKVETRSPSPRSDLVPHRSAAHWSRADARSTSPRPRCAASRDRWVTTMSGIIESPLIQMRRRWPARRSDRACPAQLLMPPPNSAGRRRFVNRFRGGREVSKASASGSQRGTCPEWGNPRRRAVRPPTSTVMASRTCVRAVPRLRGPGQLSRSGGVSSTSPGSTCIGNGLGLGPDRYARILEEYLQSTFENWQSDAAGRDVRGGVPRSCVPGQRESKTDDERLERRCWIAIGAKLGLSPEEIEPASSDEEYSRR